MSGSGNDFVFFDARTDRPGDLEDPDVVARLCARSTGIGSDGVVFLQNDAVEAFRIRYLNCDGSMAELCGNASLCTATLAVHLGLADPTGFRFATDAGPISARILNAEPEIDLRPVSELRASSDMKIAANELRIGFADTGVPHLVVLVKRLDLVSVDERGAALRHHPSLPSGANVNFVAEGVGGRWHMRTYERGVERETLACGTGAVAAAALLEAWGLTNKEIQLETRSQRVLTVTLRQQAEETSPSLRGDGRLVFAGELFDI